MSEKSDLWVPATLLLGGLVLLVVNVGAGRALIGVVALLVALVGAVACLPLRLKRGQGRVVAFGVGVGLLLVPFAPGAATGVLGVLPWWIGALAFLAPLPGLTTRVRQVALGAAVLLALLALLAVAGVAPRPLTWLFLAGAFFCAAQVVRTRPPRPAVGPPGPRICILGGSFDPFHVGHRMLASSAIRRVDRLLVVPAGEAPHKRDREVTPFHHRLAMARLGVEGLPRVEVLELEGRRAGPSYTVDTLDVVRRSFGEDARLLLLVGADMFQDLPTWKDWQRIVASCTLLVAARPGHDLEPPPEMADATVRVERLEAPLVDVAARDLRADLAAGRPVGERIPPNVVAYIRDHGLYGTGGAAGEAPGAPEIAPSS